MLHTIIWPDSHRCQTYTEEEFKEIEPKFKAACARQDKYDDVYTPIALYSIMFGLLLFMILI